MGNKTNRGRKPQKYFFLNDIPHKKLQINRSRDTLLAWNYIEKKPVMYVWSVARKNMGRAFLSTEVQQMLGRHRNSLHLYIKNGDIKTPFRTYSLDGRFSPGMYLWSEKDILDMHEMILGKEPSGRPRADGLPKSKRMPSRAELLAMMRNDVILYTKTRDGVYTPVWQEKDW